MSADVKAYALAYAQRGWHVLPVTADKRPLTSAGFKDATVDARVIEAWWEGRPEAQLAVATGASRLIVVDIDPRNGGDVSVLGEYPETLTSRTQSGGMHVYFSGNSLRSCKPWPGVDVKADSGYVLCPPSRGYEWIVRVGIAPLPERLREELGHRQERAVLPDLAGGEPIPEGLRDETLFRLACQMIRKLMNAGWDKDEAVEMTWPRMQVINASRCRPPLREEVVTAKVESAARQEYEVSELPTWRGNDRVVVEEEERVERPHEFSDLGNAQRFIDKFGEYVRYVPEWKWMVWDSKRWTPDVDGVRVTELALQLPDVIREEGTRLAEDEEELARWASWALQTGMATRVDACLKLARADRRIRAGVEHWDASALHLSVKNGVINLLTGDVWDHDPTNATTFCNDVDYDPDARDSRWEAFLKGVTGGDEELEAFLQRCVGYTLTGVTDSESFFLIHGPMQTGKTTFIDAVQSMMGPYADTTDVSTFLHTGSIVRTSEYALAKMRGTRQLYVDELPAHARLDENLVKQITSGGQLQGRHPYGKPFSFTPTAKVWFATNHKPSMYDPAIWRRVVPVPFNIKIEVTDPTIKEYFRGEARPAILAWAVKGAMEWGQRGRKLDVPAKVKREIEAYQAANDRFGQFIEECLELGDDKWSTITALFAEYTAWCQACGVARLGRNKFMGEFEGRVPPVTSEGRRKVDGRNVMVVHGARPAGGEPWKPHWA